MNDSSLNAGCGNVPLKGFVNIDKYYYPSSLTSGLDKELAEKWNTENPDSPWTKGDIVKLEYPSEHFGKVIMVHVLEHVSMEDGNKALNEAKRVLKTGGIIEVEVPDLTRACEYFPKVHITDKEDWKLWFRVMGLIYGTTGSDGDGQFHLCGYSKEYLKFKLEEVGFENVEEIPVGFGHGDSEKGHPEPGFNFRMKAVKK